MKNLLKPLLMMCVLLMFSSITAWSGSTPEYVQYTGTIVYYGSTPNAILVFVTPYGSFEIEGNLKEQLSSSRYQQRTVTLIGRVSTRISTALRNTPVFVVEQIHNESL